MGTLMRNRLTVDDMEKPDTNKRYTVRVEYLFDRPKPQVTI